MGNTFLSYSHAQEDWVYDALAPLLRASGVSVAIDIDRFRAGKLLPEQMRKEIAYASTVVLVLSKEYLQSTNCKFEMQEALSRRLEDSILQVVGVLREDCEMPPPFSGFDSELYVDLRDDSNDAQWERLIEACQGDLRCAPSDWLKAVRNSRVFLARRESVNLIYRPGVQSRPLVESIRSNLQLLAPFGIVNLESPESTTREGLIRMMWRAAFGSELPQQKTKEGGLVALQHAVRERDYTYVALTHFDRVQERHKEYGLDLWSGLRFLVVDDPQHPLVLLVLSHVAFAQLLPAGSALTQPESLAMFQTVPLE